jgi:TonB-dependent receptor
MADGRRRMAGVWMAGIWMVRRAAIVSIAIAWPALAPAQAMATAGTGAQVAVRPVDAPDRTNASPQPGSGASIEIDRAWSAAHERDATSIVSLIAGAQISAAPKSNVPENVAALPSVALDRVLGEGRYVRIRGLDPRWSSVQLEGDRLPSVDGRTRSTPLNILPGEFFEVIQISRTITPDMDGDAIAGAINLVPRHPTEQTHGSFALSGGYHGLRGDADDVGVNGMFGRRLANGRVGVVLGGSGLHETLTGNGFSAGYDAGLALSALTVRSALIDRARTGGQGTLDVKLSDRSSLVFSGIAGRLRDQNYERDTENLPAIARGSIVRALQDHPFRENLWSGSARAQHLLRGNATLDARVAVGQGDQYEEDALDTIYSLTDVRFAPGFDRLPVDPNNIQVQPLNDDLSAYHSGSQNLADALARETSVTAAANMTMPIAAAGPGPRVIKFGVKAHHLDKTEDRNFGNSYDLPPLTSVVESGFDSGPILDGRYTLGPTLNPTLARQVGTTLSTFPPGIWLANDYEGRESTVSGYVMTDLAFGSRVTLEPGVRYEWDHRRYHAWSLIYGNDPAFAITPQDATTTRGEWLPMVSARVAASARTTIRMAVTRTIARPNFSDLAPSLLGILGTVSSTGNPALRSTSSWNADLMLDQELTRGSGRVFAGLFHKRINDPIYLARLIPDANPTPGVSNPIQPRNGDRATLTGLEIGYAQPFRFLPAPWTGLGVTASYTLSDSAARVPGRVGDGSSAIFPDRPGHDVTLTGLPRHLGHVAVSYDRAGLSARMVATMQSSAMMGVGSFAWNDTFAARRTQLDFSLSQRLTSHLRAFVDVFNLTNAAMRGYMGDASHLTSDQEYGRWASFGVRVIF